MAHLRKHVINWLNFLDGNYLWVHNDCVMKEHLMCDLFLVKTTRIEDVKDMTFSGQSKCYSQIKPDHLGVAHLHNFLF